MMNDNVLISMDAQDVEYLLHLLCERNRTNEAANRGLMAQIRDLENRANRAMRCELERRGEIDG